MTKTKKTTASDRTGGPERAKQANRSPVPDAEPNSYNPQQQQSTQQETTQDQHSRSPSMQQEQQLEEHQQTSDHTPSQPYSTPANNSTPASTADTPGTVDQQAIQTAKDNLGITAIERTLNNLVQELQAQRAIQPQNGGGDWKTSLMNLIGSLANAASRASTPQTESNLAQRLLDMTLNHYAVIDQVFLKSIGLPVQPPAQHMRVVE